MKKKLIYYMIIYNLDINDLGEYVYKEYLEVNDMNKTLFEENIDIYINDKKIKFDFKYKIKIQKK